jgi:hypothetical protein
LIEYSKPTSGLSLWAMTVRDVSRKNTVCGAGSPHSGSSGASIVSSGTTSIRSNRFIGLWDAPRP